MNGLYQQYIDHIRKYSDVEYASAVLAWDKEVNCPPKGMEIRAQQMATLAGMAHELFSDAAFGRILHELKDDENLDVKARRNIAVTLREFQRAEKLSTEFVIRRSRAVSTAFEAWLAARVANDFAPYKAALANLISIKREEAGLLSNGGHSYDALLEAFEPGCTVAELDPLFEDVKAQLVDFAEQIRKKPRPDNDFLFRHYPKDKQWEYGLLILKKIGYDFSAGRQDISTHPFTINFGPTDVRLTTRIDENDFGNMTWSCIHEGGHALYEQGLPMEDYGLPSGKYLSLGIHESQSRLWENNVGRGLPFWKAHYPELQQFFPGQLKDISLQDFYRAINIVQPSLIRTEADEIHYHFHILIRYEIEKAMLDGTVEVDQLESLWNNKYEAYLGVKVPDARRGILQDIHWSHGSIGYFPTYSLGSFYAAQFHQQAQLDIPGLIKQTEQGDHSHLLAWLRENIHRHGQQFTAAEICERITGEPLNFSYFMKYVVEKYGEMYAL